jgi:hypothetical protein
MGLRVRETVGGGPRSVIAGLGRAGLAIAAATLSVCAAHAQDAPLQLQNAAPQQQSAPASPAPAPAPDQSPMHSLAKSLGFATDVDPPPDFVQQSRPGAPQQEIPIFTPPPEPPGKVKSAKQVEAIDDDLEAIVKRHDALRAAYPPSARAVAEAKKAKSKPKPVIAGPAPPL